MRGRKTNGSNSVLDDAGGVDGLTASEFRDVLNGHLSNAGASTNTMTKRRSRAKKALLEAEIIEERDDLIFLLVYPRGMTFRLHTNVGKNLHLED